MPQNGEKQVDKSEYLFCNENFYQRVRKNFYLVIEFEKG